MPAILEKEINTYISHKAELLGNSKGKFVLIKDDQIVGTFENKMDAIRQGYERYGNVPFLVRQVVEIDAPLNFTSNLMGV